MNIQQLMKQAQTMQADMMKAEQELAAKISTVDRQGIKLSMNGVFELKSVSIDPMLLKVENKEMLEDILVMNINQLTKQIQDDRAETVGTLTQGLKIPGVL
ncbi:MAG: YbaB/EbfC family nucleoid-associated protein [Erysipelotrichaceae bacterium]